MIRGLCSVPLLCRCSLLLGGIPVVVEMVTYPEKYQSLFEQKITVSILKEAEDGGTHKDNTTTPTVMTDA